MIDLSGCVALVTGAGQGIGAACADHLAVHGAAVAVNDVVAERAASVARSIEVSGGRAIAVPADVTDFDAVMSMVDDVHERLGVVTVMVNNAGNAGVAGSPAPQPFWEGLPSDWRPYLGVNLDAVMYCCRAVIPGMIAAGQGRLITIVSDAGRVGEASFEAYAAANAGAAGLMRSLARSLGRYEITANAVSVGLTATPTMASVLDDEALAARMLAKYIIRRPGRPGDVAAMVTFLSSGAASWITGQTYPVNGGFSNAL